MLICAIIAEMVCSCVDRKEPYTCIARCFTLELNDCQSRKAEARKRRERKHWGEKKTEKEEIKAKVILETTWMKIA